MKDCIVKSLITLSLCIITIQDVSGLSSERNKWLPGGDDFEVRVHAAAKQAETVRQKEAFKRSKVFQRMCDQNEFLGKGHWHYRGQTAQAVIDANRELGSAHQKKFFRRLHIAKGNEPVELIQTSSGQQIPRLRLPGVRQA